ncbi:hypothetical protein [Cellulomonas sp. IC4_254]|uniref:hypothetical protein n=1 Tax=Cellulomonas sp. IC4_254 TaxID=2714040 RepID=UPI001F0D3EBD|nr:hypothetical protein [Cellulomonas sp. IC4_254]
MAMSLQEATEMMMRLDGLLAIASVDYTSGMVLQSQIVHQYDMELAAATATEVVRAQVRALEQLEGGQIIDDILIQTSKEMHLIVLSADPRYAGVFTYLVLDRWRGNLALARRRLHELAEAGVDL